MRPNGRLTPAQSRLPLYLRQTNLLYALPRARCTYQRSQRGDEDAASSRQSAPTYAALQHSHRRGVIPLYASGNFHRQASGKRASPLQLFESDAVDAAGMMTVALSTPVLPVFCWKAETVIS